MDRARGELLAAAGRAVDQDATVGRGDLVDHVAQLVDSRRLANHQGRPLWRELLELFHLALEPGIFQRAVRDQHEPVSLERLFDKVVGAALDCRDRSLDVAVAGNHYDRQVGVLTLHTVEQLQAVEFRALQPNVEEEEIWPPGADRPERGIAVARGPCLVAFILQDPGNKLANIRFVVHDQDVRGRHDYLLAISRACVVSAGSVLALAALSDAKRRWTHAPRPPVATSGASANSMRPPCSSKMRPTMARPRPVPFSRVVTYGSSRRFRFSFGRPVPLSITSITISAPSRFTET